MYILKLFVNVCRNKNFEGIFFFIQLDISKNSYGARSGILCLVGNLGSNAKYICYFEVISINT